MSRMLIQGAMLYPMTDQAPFVGDVYIENGKIAAIGHDLNREADEVVDARGLVALPGLVDAHSHLGGFNMVNLSDIDFNEMTDPATPQMRALDGCNLHDPCFALAAEAGITTMCITPGSGNVVCGLAFTTKSAGSDNLRDLVIQNPCALKCALGMNPKGVYGPRNQMPMTRMGIAKILRDTLKKGQEYLKKKEAAAGDSAKLPPYDEKCEAVALALTGKIPLKVHCEQQDMLTTIEIAKEFGCRYTIEHAWWSEPFLDQLAEGGGCINYGPVGVPTGYGELTGARLAEVGMLDRRGLTVSIITDAPICSPDVLLLQAGEAVRCGVPHERVLRMITINPARALEIDHKVGSLEVGKDGDVALFSAVPGLDVSARVCMTIIEGKVVYQKAR
jgi:imidazolonepropionase-like amidohydrolase